MEQSTRGDQVTGHSSDVPGREASRPLRMLVASSLGIATGILATLRSPFLPQAYAAVPPLWLLTLLAATHAPSTKASFLTLLGWMSLNVRSEEHTSELQSQSNLVCRLLLEKKKKKTIKQKKNKTHKKTEERKR